MFPTRRMSNRQPGTLQPAAYQGPENPIMVLEHMKLPAGEVSAVAPSKNFLGERHIAVLCSHSLLTVTILRRRLMTIKASLASRVLYTNATCHWAAKRISARGSHRLDGPARKAAEAQVQAIHCTSGPPRRCSESSIRISAEGPLTATPACHYRKRRASSRRRPAPRLARRWNRRKSQ